MHKLPLLVALLFAVSAQANTSQASPTYKGFKINVSALQSNLGLGSVDPTRSIQQAVTSLSHEASSSVVPYVIGSTSATDCNTDNVITASTGCSSFGCNYPAETTFCGGGARFLITLFKPSGYGYTWSNLNDGGSSWEVSQVVLQEILVSILGVQDDTDTACISNSGHNPTGGTTRRNAFCEPEIEALAYYSSGHQSHGLVSIRSKASEWPLPTTGTSEWYTPITLDGGEKYGLGGFTHERGEDYYPPAYNNDSIFVSEVDNSDHRVKENYFNTGDWNLSSDHQLPSGANTLRRPASAYDPTRRVWYLFMHIAGSNTDEVSYYTSTNNAHSSWTYRGKVREDANGHNHSASPHPDPTPIHTWHPVSAGYNQYKDRVQLVFMPATGSNYAMKVVSIHAGDYANEMKWEGDDTGYLATTASNGASFSGVPVMGCGYAMCHIVYSDASTDRGLVHVSGRINNEDCSRAPGSSATTHCGHGAYYGQSSLGGSSDWPAAVACVQGSGDNCEFVITGTNRDALYVQRFNGTSFSGSWEDLGVNYWNYGNQGLCWGTLVPTTGPTIRARDSSEDYQIVVGGYTTHYCGGG